ncbi:MAG: succinate dehydrogenase cytochrome b subunit [Myxococcales bacterium]|nr:succinate dehydrogenase cytochrome b subunit [Myxococcales bacterium]
MSAPKKTAKRGLAGLMDSTIGAKILMALTGFVLVGFVVQHMVMNLQLYAGPEALNSYAHNLKHMMGGGFVWGGRAFLLACIAIHIQMAMKLTNRNRDARPQRYAAGQRTQVTSYAAQFMALTGVVILLFVIYHLLHFTGGVVQPDNFHVLDAEGRHDVWRMVVTSFKDPATSIAYIVANIALAFHLSHSVTSMFATLGLQSGRYRPILAKVGPAIAAFVLLGNLSFPISVLAGLVHI